MVEYSHSWDNQLQNGIFYLFKNVKKPMKLSFINQWNYRHGLRPIEISYVITQSTRHMSYNVCQQCAMAYNDAIVGQQWFYHNTHHKFIMCARLCRKFCSRHPANSVIALLYWLRTIWSCADLFSFWIWGLLDPFLDAWIRLVTWLR